MVPHRARALTALKIAEGEEVRGSSVLAKENRRRSRRVGETKLTSFTTVIGITVAKVHNMRQLGADKRKTCSTPGKYKT